MTAVKNKPAAKKNASKPAKGKPAAKKAVVKAPREPVISLTEYAALRALALSQTINLKERERFNLNAKLEKKGLVDVATKSENKLVRETAHGIFYKKVNTQTAMLTPKGAAVLERLTKELFGVAE